MFKRLSRHVTYANIVASLALFLALSGTAYAVATITGADVVDESLTGADVKGAAPSPGHAAVAGTLTTYDIKDQTIHATDLSPDAVTGPKVLDNSLGGADVDESSLGQVPLAGYADQAGNAYSADVASSLTSIEKWHYIGDAGEPGFQNGWSNYDASASHTAAQWQHVAYARDALGFVHLRGLIKGGTVGQTMFQLPTSYCPWFYHAFGVISNNAFARVTVTWVSSSGCFIYLDFGSNAWVSLEGVTFQTYTLEDRTSAPASTAHPTPYSLPGSPRVDGPPRMAPKR